MLIFACFLPFYFNFLFYRFWYYKIGVWGPLKWSEKDPWNNKLHESGHVNQCSLSPVNNLAWQGWNYPSGKWHAIWNHLLFESVTWHNTRDVHNRMSLDDAQWVRVCTDMMSWSDHWATQTANNAMWQATCLK